MFYVYVLKSISFPDQMYVGFTNNVEQRLTDHNAGNSPHTKKYRPWTLEFYACFKSEKTAFEFEKYLKSCSGRAFMLKRLL